MPCRRRSPAPILPWKSPENARTVSPLEAAVLYLKHLVDAWNHQIAKDVAEHRLENQDIILTVPASFDAVARELTVEAAKAAGLEKLTLLEEPQSAFYAWIDARRTSGASRSKSAMWSWSATSAAAPPDFSLIAVSEEAGNLVLTRVAVGDHILLGGDNMDLALAHHAAAAFAAKGVKLDAGQMHMLWHSCRLAKETLFGSPDLAAGRRSRSWAAAARSSAARSRANCSRPMSRSCSSMASSRIARADDEAAAGSARSACRRSACPTPPTRPSASIWRSSWRATTSR